MSELFKNLNRINMSGGAGSPLSTREAAVAAALEVIAGAVSSGAPINVESEMKSLSSYADLIQEALKVKAE